MTRWLAAAQQTQQGGTQLTQPTKPLLKEVSSVMSVLSEGVRDAAASFGYEQKLTLYAKPPVESQKVDAFQHGTSPGGRPLTYTGRVVSLEAWRTLFEWERDGPDGRIWDGKANQWIKVGKANT